MCCDELEVQVSSVKSVTTGVDALIEEATLEQPLCRKGNRYVTMAGVLGFVEGLGSMVCNMFDLIVDAEQDEVLEWIANFVLDLCDRIDRLVVIRDTQNAPQTATFPPVRPFEIIKLRPRQFYSLLNEQRGRLLHSFSES